MKFFVVYTGLLAFVTSLELGNFQEQPNQGIYTQECRFMGKEVRENRAFFLLRRRVRFSSPSAGLSRGTFKSLPKIYTPQYNRQTLFTNIVSRGI